MYEKGIILNILNQKKKQISLVHVQIQQIIVSQAFKIIICDRYHLQIH